MLLRLFAPLLAYVLIKIITRTLRISVVGKEHIEDETASHVYGIWHSDFFAYANFGDRAYKRRIVVMTSYSEDGEILSRAIRLLGGNVVRGDERRHGSRALIKAMRMVREEGKSVVFALDGPLGPRHRAKAGAVFACRKLGLPLTPIVTIAEKAWRFSSWDEFFIPKPFSRVNVVFGEPITFTKEMTEEEACATIEGAMNALYQKHAWPSKN